MDVYMDTVELIARCEPFCRDRYGQDAALDHLGVRGGIIRLSPKIHDGVLEEDYDG